MPFILNANAQVMCSHGGMFQFIPATAPTVMVGGAPVLTIADQAVPKTPCPFATARGPFWARLRTTPSTVGSASAEPYEPETRPRLRLVLKSALGQRATANAASATRTTAALRTTAGPGQLRGVRSGHDLLLAARKRHGSGATD